MKLSNTVYSMNQYCRDGSMSVRGFIEFCAEAGFDGVDLGYFWQDEQAEIDQVPIWLKESGLALSGYIVGNNFTAARDSEAKAAEVDKVKHAIDCAARLDAKRLRIFAGADRGVTFEDGRDHVLDCLRRVTEYGEKKGIVLCLEDHHGLAARSDHMLWYHRRIDSDFFKFNVDIGNFVFGDEDPVEGTRRTAPYAEMVHVKDFRVDEDGRYRGETVGRGIIDIKGCLGAILDTGYDGFASLEYEGSDEARKGNLESLAYVREVLAELDTTTT